jgi:hypothetical protein
MDRLLRNAFAQWTGPLIQHWEMKAREDLIATRKEIADQRAVMAAQAKIISLLWARQRAAMHLDDVVADYSSLRSFASGADKMIFSSD